LTGIYFFNPAAFHFKKKAFIVMTVDAFMHSPTPRQFAKPDQLKGENTRIESYQSHAAVTRKHLAGSLDCNILKAVRIKQSLPELTQRSLFSTINTNQIPLPFYT